MSQLQEINFTLVGKILVLFLQQNQFDILSLFRFQTFVKWSAPDEDNKCLGEVLLTIDPKYKGSSTGNVNLFLSTFYPSKWLASNFSQQCQPRIIY